MPYDPADNTYARAAAVPNLTATGGASDNTLADGGATYSQAIFNDNFRDVATKINAILAALRASNVVVD